MCDVVDKFVNQGRREGVQKGRMSVLIELVKDGALTIQKAAEKAGMDVATFELQLKA